MESQVVEQAFSSSCDLHTGEEATERSCSAGPVRALRMGFELKVLVTNKDLGAGVVVDYCKGRGLQEDIFEELELQCHLDYETAA